jgi:hypothetical protein
MNGTIIAVVVIALTANFLIEFFDIVVTSLPIFKDIHNSTTIELFYRKNRQK